MSDATRVAIVGLGAIGGSAALALLRHGITPHGYAASDADRSLARAAGVAVAESTERAVTDADLVLIAVPLDHLADVARRTVAAAPATATLLHAASLQRPAATGFDDALAERVIGTHPLAGTAQDGFGAAVADLFRGATVLAEPSENRQSADDVQLFWSMAGAARIEILSAEEHDARMAAISHLPQIVSTALVVVLANSRIQPEMLGPGGRDMTRLAMSSWSMWAPLIANAPNQTPELLGALIKELTRMHEAMATHDAVRLEASWAVAREWRA